jgi:hypothetical protein
MLSGRSKRRQRRLWMDTFACGGISGARKGPPAGTPAASTCLAPPSEPILSPTPSPRVNANVGVWSRRYAAAGSRRGPHAARLSGHDPGGLCLGVGLGLGAVCRYVRDFYSRFSLCSWRWWPVSSSHLTASLASFLPAAEGCQRRSKAELVELGILKRQVPNATARSPASRPQSVYRKARPAHAGETTCFVQ